MKAGETRYLVYPSVCLFAIQVYVVTGLSSNRPSSNDLNFSSQPNCDKTSLKENILVYTRSFDMATCDEKDLKTENRKSEDPTEEALDGGLSPEMIAQISSSIPDLEIDYSSTKQKFITGLGNTLPMAPIVNQMRGGMPHVLQGAGIPPQGAQQQGAPVRAQGAQGAAGNAMQGQQPQGQGRGAPPPPQRYAWENDDIAGTIGDNQQTMLC